MAGHKKFYRTDPGTRSFISFSTINVFLYLKPFSFHFHDLIRELGVSQPERGGVSLSASQPANQPATLGAYPIKLFTSLVLYSQHFIFFVTYEWANKLGH
jgi:hypothetical protein